MTERYFRPVGRFHYGYCFRVDEVHEYDGYLRFTAVRFGMNHNHQPVMDGHQDKHWPGGMVKLRPDLYRVHDIYGNAWWGAPLYFREIASRGQMELFT